MFDPATAQLLRSAPALPGLDPSLLPQLLTMHYAKLVSARLDGASEDISDQDDGEWPLERIADTYELITSIHSDTEVRRASAFVAATAHQILSRRELRGAIELPPWNISRDRVDPTIASALLFLAAEQYADANEAASAIVTARLNQPYEVTILSENIRDLARGHLRSILDRATQWRTDRHSVTPLHERALLALLDALISGVELMAARMLSVSLPAASMGRFDTARHAFVRVLELSSNSDSSHSATLKGDLFTTYAGPRHLASLLLSAHDGIESAALAELPPPDGADSAFWNKWLQLRATHCPFVWPNHRQAIKQGFYNTGKSAVMVLPTGAGKTTVSALKIAGVIARGKKVVFLAPTHALVEQLTDDLREMFPRDLLGHDVSSDFDLSMLLDFNPIEVMTPEACLAMLSFAPTAFAEVGLLVFDECHLLSPASGKIRRALDGMLCLLAFNHVVPHADLLFLSAMLKNGHEFAEWIQKLTSRDCVCVELLWKPSRQARGVLIYKEEELAASKESALKVQLAKDKESGKKAKSLRAVAKKELRAHPFAIWGLQHNWLSGTVAHCSFTPLLSHQVQLAGDNKYGPVRLTPNANQVASRLAVAAANSGVKTIVFVNTKQDAVSVARAVSLDLGGTITPLDDEQERWKALEVELGGLKHSILAGATAAVPHNASMLRLERDLAERLFRRRDGARVIVATPTLAQGLNLPAQLAILAGDKRADRNGGGREDLEAHEILNAAARAGRAGHLANGVVLLIPEPIISFSEGEPLDAGVVHKLQAVLPEDDRCVLITDPLEVVLDRLMAGQTDDRDVHYLINRLAALRKVEGVEEPSTLFNLNQSLAAYVAQQKAADATFQTKIALLKSNIVGTIPEAADSKIAVLASQSGLPTELLLRLKERLEKALAALPITITGWIEWTFSWLSDDESSRSLLLYEMKGSVLAATGRSRSDSITPPVLADLLPGVRAWINGKPLCEIEILLGGDPSSDVGTCQICPRARELVSTVVPRGLSFIMGLISHVVEGLDPYDRCPGLERQLIDCLGAAIRRGFDTPEKLMFALHSRSILSRVQAHRAYSEIRSV